MAGGRMPEKAAGSGRAVVGCGQPGRTSNFRPFGAASCTSLHLYLYNICCFEIGGRLLGLFDGLDELVQFERFFQNGGRLLGMQLRFDILPGQAGGQYDE